MPFIIWSSLIQLYVIVHLKSFCCLLHSNKATYTMYSISKNLNCHTIVNIVSIELGLIKPNRNNSQIRHHSTKDLLVLKIFRSVFFSFWGGGGYFSKHFCATNQRPFTQTTQKGHETFTSPKEHKNVLINTLYSQEPTHFHFWKIVKIMWIIINVTLLCISHAKKIICTVPITCTSEIG